MQRASVGNTFYPCQSTCTIIGGVPCTINLRELSLFVSYVTKHRGEVAKWRPFWDLFVFYSEPAHQKPALVVHGTREDANPSVNDKVATVTLLRARPYLATELSLVPLQVYSTMAISSCNVSASAYTAWKSITYCLDVSICIVLAHQAWIHGRYLAQFAAIL